MKGDNKMNKKNSIIAISMFVTLFIQLIFSASFVMASEDMPQEYVERRNEVQELIKSSKAELERFINSSHEEINNFMERIDAYKTDAMNQYNSNIEIDHQEAANGWKNVMLFYSELESFKEQHQNKGLNDTKEHREIITEFLNRKKNDGTSYENDFYANSLVRILQNNGRNKYALEKYIEAENLLFNRFDKGITQEEYDQIISDYAIEANQNIPQPIRLTYDLLLTCGLWKNETKSDESNNNNNDSTSKNENDNAKKDDDNDSSNDENIDEKEIPVSTEVPPNCVTFTRGRVLIKRHDSNKWTRLKSGMVLNAGDAIKTDKNSIAELSGGFGGSSPFIKLNQKSYMIVPKYVPKIEKNSRIRIMGEDILNNVKNLIGKGEYEVETPSAMTGIRGTDFIVDVDESGNTTLLLYEGSIVVTSKFDNSQVILEPGQKVSVSMGDKISDVQPLTEEDIDEFREELETVKAIKEGRLDEFLAQEFDNNAGEGNDEISMEVNSGRILVITFIVILLGIPILIIVLTVVAFRKRRRIKMVAKQQGNKNDHVTYDAMDQRASGINQPIQRENKSPHINKLKFCSNCGNKIENGSKFCTNCGKAL